MVRNYIKKYINLLLIIIVCLCASVNAEENSYILDVKDIKLLYENWHRAVESGDIDGYIDSLDKNITLIPPGGPIISGLENYRVFLGPVFKSASYKIKAGDYDIEIIGDIAIVRSRQTVYLTFKNNENKIESEGALQNNITTSDYLDVLKRQDNGSWKCLVHSWQEVAIN